MLYEVHLSKGVKRDLRLQCIKIIKKLRKELSIFSVNFFIISGIYLFHIVTVIKNI